MRCCLVLSVLVLLTSLLSVPVAAPALDGCSFTLGFKTLHDLIPDIVGDCAGVETYNPDNDDEIQITTHGLLVWRRADNWTAFTDGATTWINGPCGLQSRPNDVRLPWELGAPCSPPPPEQRKTIQPSAREVAFVRTRRPVVALTFDTDGVLGATPRTLAALHDRGIHATFFVTGLFASRYPGVVRQMVADGHELGNHSFSHPYFTRLSDALIWDELDRTDALIQKITGQSTKPLMRMPFGARNARVLTAVETDGYRSISWSVDPRDWRPGMTPDAITAQVLSRVAPGAIVLQHCSVAASAAALPAILDGLAARGLSVIPVSDLLQDQ